MSDKRQEPPLNLNIFGFRESIDELKSILTMHCPFHNSHRQQLIETVCTSIYIRICIKIRCGMIENRQGGLGDRADQAYHCEGGEKEEE